MEYPIYNSIVGTQLRHLIYLPSDAHNDAMLLAAGESAPQTPIRILASVVYSVAFLSAKILTRSSHGLRRRNQKGEDAIESFDSVRMGEIGLLRCLIALNQFAT